MKTYILTIVLFGTFLAITYSLRVQDSLLDYPPTFKRHIALLAPQGWAFFTKSSKDPNYFIYKKTSTGDYNRISTSNTSRKNLFGLSRESRRISHESAIILNQLATAEWKEFRGPDLPDDSLLDENHIFNESSSVKHLEAGEYMIYRETPIPWAWQANFQEKNIRREYVLVNLSNCNS